MTSQTNFSSRLTSAERRRGIAAAIACLTVVGACLGASMPFLALVLAGQGVPPAMIGLNSAIPSLAGLIATPFIPKLMQHVPANRLVVISLILAAMAMIGCYLVQNYWAWFPLRAVIGASITIAFVISEIWINALADEKTRGRIMGVYGAVLAIGFAAGPVVLFLAGSEGFLPFGLIAGLALTACVPVLMAGDTAPGGEGHAPSRSFAAFLTVAPTATLAAFVFGAVEQGVMNLLPIYGVKIGLTSQVAALVLTAFAAGNILCQVPLGILADRMNRRLLLAICGGLGGGIIALLPLVAGTPLIFPAIFVFGGMVTGLYSVGLTLLGQRFHGPDLAAANSAFVMCYSIGALMGPPIGGAAMQAWVPHGLPASMAVFGLGYMALALWRWQTAKADPAAG